MRLYRYIVRLFNWIFCLSRGALFGLLTFSCSNGMLNSGIERCQNGLERNDICWVLSASDESCNAACEDLGGAAPEAALYVGTPMQGGSLTECTYLVSRLATEKTYPIYSVQAYTDQGLGCYKFGEAVFWITDFPLDPNQHALGAQIVCGCTGWE